MIENEEKTTLDTPVVEEETVNFTPIKKKPIVGYVTGGSLNLRAEPSKDADVIMLLQDNEPVVLDSVKTINGFYKVTAHNAVGYCAKEFITIK